MTNSYEQYCSYCNNKLETIPFILQYNNIMYIFCNPLCCRGYFKFKFDNTFFEIYYKSLQSYNKQIIYHYILSNDTNLNLLKSNIHLCSIPYNLLTI